MYADYKSAVVAKVKCPQEPEFFKAVSKTGMIGASSYGTGFRLSECQRQAVLANNKLEEAGQIAEFSKRFIIQSFPDFSFEIASYLDSSKYSLQDTTLENSFRKRFNIPEEWKVYWKLSTDISVCKFMLDCEFYIKHDIAFEKIFDRSQRRSPDYISSYVLGLLSGYITLGEAINQRNYKNHCILNNLKFLPFLIDPRGYRFNIYMPTDEAINIAIKDFKAILASLTDFTSSFYFDLIHRIDAKIKTESAIRFNKPLGNALLNDLNNQLNRRIGQYRGKFGFVYKNPGLKGSQSVVKFKWDPSIIF